MSPHPFLMSAGLVTFTLLLSAQTPPAPAVAPVNVAVPRDVKEVYATFCASCHGANLEGGSGMSLADDVWKYGADDASIARSIREGYPANGMPAFGAVLDEAKTRSLVVYLREMGARAEERRTTVAKPADRAVTASELHRYRLEPVATGLDVPWSMAFLPDGRMLVTEREGRLRVIENGRLHPRGIEGLPRVWAEGQGGLLAVAPHPDFATNGWIYLAFSDPGPGGSAMTKVVRGRLRDNRWVDQETIYAAPPDLYRSGRVHFGTRLVFDGAGYLFFSIGERGRQDDAQTLSRPNGKIHRVHDDGRIPADNPFVATPRALPSIWSYGHRNPQGIDRHPETGALWATEHGPRGGDELNRVERGRNYGWPVITYGMNYNGTPVTDRTAQEGMEQPVIHWTPSIAVSGIAFYRGDAFPRWRNHLFVGALARQELRRVVIDAERVVHQEVLFKNIGRIRDVISGPDGYIYVAFEGPGRIMRLVPAD